MNWKEDLVKKINALKPEDFPDGMALIQVPICLTNARDAFFRIRVEAGDSVNSHPVGWAGPGYLKMQRPHCTLTSEGTLEGVLWFELLRDRKFNEFFVEDVFTGQIGKVELPIYDSIDFLSL